MAHAVLGAVVAEINGNSALAGAAGAAGGELAAQVLADKLYGKKPSELTEQERQNVSTLGTIVGGLAGGLAGKGSGDVVAGGEAGKNAVENNFLNMAAKGCAVASPCRSKVAEQLLEIGVKAGVVGLAGVAVREVAENMTAEELEHFGTLVMMGNDEITGKYLSSLQDKYVPSHTGNDQIIDLGSTNTGGNQLPEQGSTHTGNNDGKVDVGSGNTGGDQTVETLPTNTGNTEGAPDLSNHYESTGKPDNRLPIPEATTSQNGLKIESNPKHTPGAQGFRPNAGTEPRNSLDLFDNSIATKDPKIRLSIDSDGNIHRFFNTSKDGSGAFHWSGSTGDKANALGNRELGNFNKEIKELKGKK